MCACMSVATSLLLDWLTQRTVNKVVVVIADALTGESVERWQFDIECDKSTTAEAT